MEAAGYRYDVFFSYKRHEQNEYWINRVANLLRYWLAHELGVLDAKVFWDRDCIEAGDRWPDSLRLALRDSKCLVAIWSPCYFQSPWCVLEWRSFLAREKRLNLEVHGLVAPVRYHDGDLFPAEAKDVHWADFAPYTSTLESFWNTSGAVQLEDEIKDLARIVAGIVRRAPAFEPDWPIVDANSTPLDSIPQGKL